MIYEKGGTYWLRPVLGGPTTSYDSAQAKADLGGIPDEEELTRLAKYYPKYKNQVHRQGIIQGVLSGKAHAEMLETWIEHKNQGELKGISKGGPGKSVPTKIKRLVIRLLYVRLRHDGMTQPEANKALMGQFDLGPSAISKITTSKIMDKEFQKPT